MIDEISFVKLVNLKNPSVIVSYSRLQLSNVALVPTNQCLTHCSIAVNLDTTSANCWRVRVLIWILFSFSNVATHTFSTWPRLVKLYGKLVGFPNINLGSFVMIQTVLVICPEINWDPFLGWT